MKKRKQRKSPPKRKNVSQTIPNGRTLQTRDEFLESGKNYFKPGYNQKGLYRKVVVIDTNRNNELAVVKLTTKGKHKLPNYQKGKSSFKPIIETKDNKNNPIVLGSKFKEHSPKQDLDKKDITKIKKESLKKSSTQTKKNNKIKLRQMKNRK